jgi:hypothetical protein
MTAPDIDPAIHEAVQEVTNRFGSSGLEDLISLAQQELATARAALEELGDEVP